MFVYLCDVMYVSVKVCDYFYVLENYIVYKEKTIPVYHTQSLDSMHADCTVCKGVSLQLQSVAIDSSSCISCVPQI